MGDKKDRKLSGIILTGTFIAPAIISAAQQNTASANLGDLLKAESIKTGLSAAWSNPVVGSSIIIVGTLGVAALAGVITYLVTKRIDNTMCKDMYGENIDVDELDSYQRLPM